jgi:transcriptional regulator with XRE-family HTH domain
VFDADVATQPVEITALARANIRAERARANLTQASVARRMRQLGYAWHPQTVGLVERNERPLLADELAALALCLETRPEQIALPIGDERLVTFGDVQIPAQRLWIDDGSVSWDGDDLKVTPPTVQYRPAELRQTVWAMREMIRQVETGETTLPPPEPGDLDAEDLPPGWRPGAEGEDREKGD